MNPDVEVSSKTSLSQNTHKEGFSRGTTDTNLAGDTEAENTAKGKTLGHVSGRKIMIMQTSKDFLQSQNMTRLSGISQ